MEKRTYTWMQNYSQSNLKDSGLQLCWKCHCKTDGCHHFGPLPAINEKTAFCVQFVFVLKIKYAEPQCKLGKAPIRLGRAFPSLEPCIKSYYSAGSQLEIASRKWWSPPNWYLKFLILCGFAEAREEVKNCVVDIGKISSGAAGR